MTPAEEFDDIGGRFGAVVEGVPPDLWDVSTPVPEWAARDVVRHLLEWFPALTQGLDLDLPTGPPVDDDPVIAWRVFAGGVQALLEDPGSSTLVPGNPNFGGAPLPEAVSRFFTADVFQHTWDLARATGQDDTLDPGRCAAMLAGMEPIEELIRQSGQFGLRVDVAEDADAQSKLLGFIGRNPLWRPPART